MLRLLLLLLALASPAAANDWDALKTPGAIAIMRHALAPGTGDPANLTLGDCSTQRNLDDRGRAQAKEIGTALRARGIRFDAVLTSQWCRCRETAALLDLGTPEDLPALNSFFRDRSTAGAQTKALLGYIGETEKNLMLVTHQVNITALTGVFPRSGEVIVIRSDGETVEVLGRILIDP